jgi:hypothetical protein
MEFECGMCRQLWLIDHLAFTFESESTVFGVCHECVVGE